MNVKKEMIKNLWAKMPEKQIDSLEKQAKKLLKEISDERLKRRRMCFAHLCGIGTIFAVALSICNFSSPSILGKFVLGIVCGFGSIMLYLPIMIRIEEYRNKNAR